MPIRSYGGSSRHFQRPPFRHNRFKSNRRGLGEHIDPLRFINKAVIAKEADGFVPEHSFQDFKLEQRLKQAILAKNYKTPTPIQDKAIPHILAGADVAGLADPGTGKTA